MEESNIQVFENKATLDDTSPVSPALAFLDGRMYLAWKGDGNNHLNVMYSDDHGKTFGHKYTSPERSPDSPALCTHNGHLYIAWKGDGNDNLNVAQVTVIGDEIRDFSKKVILNDTSPVRPTLASLNDRLYIGWKGNGNNHLNVMYSDDHGKTFGHKYTSPERSPNSPALCTHNDKIYIAWKGDGNDNLNVAQVTVNGNIITGFSDKVILGDTSPVSPTLASIRVLFKHLLCIAWKGNGNDYLNVMYSDDHGKTFGHKYTSSERSPDSLALCTHNGHLSHDYLYVAWKGDGNDNLNVAKVV
ncbi:sialidase family protein [Methanosarcina sp.]|uniref:sialidase family protein n=1 Tax=Methanosarcina sp. TaxID=2213 RepID=UPI002ABA9666|nr:sialidase family protein [Methanosarcina sp.]MDY9927374.1 sialidase family protein [Methanosarcina sp.]